MSRHTDTSKISGSCVGLTCYVLAFSALTNATAQNVSPSDQQTALVTFYSHGTTTGGLFPGSKHGTFDGLIFDGNKSLVSFQEEFFIHSNRFITLRLPAGQHDFVATTGDDPQREKHIRIILLPDQKYFLRAQIETGIIGGVQKARLDSVTCIEAHEDAPDAKSIHLKHPSPALSAQLVSNEEIPSCQ